MNLHEQRLGHHPTRRLRATLPIKGRERESFYPMYVTWSADGARA
jgi:hypothetical protein